MIKITLSFKENIKDIELYNFIYNMDSKSSWIKHCCRKEMERIKKEQKEIIDISYVDDVL